MNIDMTRYGSGRHIESTTPAELGQLLLRAYFARLLYQLVLGTTKIGLCLFNIRIFWNKASRQWMYSIIAVTTVYTLAIGFQITFQCRPVKGAWDIFIQPPPKCISNTPGLIASSVLNVAVDSVLIVFVLVKISKLERSFICFCGD
jgi:hypothetical protein